MNMTIIISITMNITVTITITITMFWLSASSREGRQGSERVAYSRFPN